MNVVNPHNVKNYKPIFQNSRGNGTVPAFLNPQQTFFFNKTKTVAVFIKNFRAFSGSYPQNQVRRQGPDDSTTAIHFVVQYLIVCNGLLCLCVNPGARRVVDLCPSAQFLD